MKIRALFLLPAVLSAQVSFDRLLHTDAEPHNWLTYSGSLSGQRYSLLDKVTPQNAKNLELKWVFQARSLEKFEATPLVVDGIMYTVQAPNDIVALDAATGRVFWTYNYTPSTLARPCCGRVNRGVAIAGDTLFMGTIDARLIAVDAKNGKPLWIKEIGKPEQGYAITHAPLVIKDKVVIGVAGGDADDDLVLDDERRMCDGVALLGLADFLDPEGLSIFRVDGNQARVDRSHEERVAGNRDAAIHASAAGSGKRGRRVVIGPEDSARGGIECDDVV